MHIVAVHSGCNTGRYTPANFIMIESVNKTPESKSPQDILHTHPRKWAYSKHGYYVKDAELDNWIVWYLHYTRSMHVHE